MEKQTRVFHTASAEETMALGPELASILRGSRLVLLRGDLGAGKTTLVKGLAEAFGAAERDDVSSPTFTLMHEYRGDEISVFHIDLYRLETDRELATLGLEEMLAEDDVILLIEWGEKFPRLMRDRDYEITLERTGPDDRKIIVTRNK